MECPRCGKELWGVEYALGHPEHWDGVSEWACQDKECGYRVGRFTGKELKAGEWEPRNGRPW